MPVGPRMGTRYKDQHHRCKIREMAPQEGRPLENQIQKTGTPVWERNGSETRIQKVMRGGHQRRRIRDLPGQQNQRLEFKQSARQNRTGLRWLLFVRRKLEKETNLPNFYKETYITDMKQTMNKVNLSRTKQNQTHKKLNNFCKINIVNIHPCPKGKGTVQRSLVSCRGSVPFSKLVLRTNTTTTDDPRLDKRPGWETSCPSSGGGTMSYTGLKTRTKNRPNT